MILDKIRTATSRVHNELEQASLMKHFSSQSITRPIYIDILNRLYGYFHPLELTLHRYSEITAYLPDYHQRKKSGMISEDLRKINGHYIEPGYCSDLPAIDSAGKAFGCLYVMEDPLPVGKLIPGILEEKLGITSTNGAGFFYDYGKHTSEKLQTFRDALNVFSIQYNNDEEIISGANETLARLKKWLNE